MTNAALIGITLLAIAGAALLFHVLIKVTPEESWAFSIMTILTLIYISGLFGNTRIAIWLLYLLGAIGILLSAIAVIRKSDHSLKTFFSPGIVMIFGIAGVGIIAFKGMHICNWDELYQWGKAANYMVEFDKLPGGSDFSGESILLSATTFFHYFIAKLSAAVTGKITESNYYVSNLLLWFSALILPFSGEGWKEYKRIWGFGVFHFLLTALIFVQPYYNIYTDQATAYWAGGVIAWLLLKKQNKRNLWLVPLILLNVGMMKSMVGPLFSVIVILSIFILYGTSRHIEKKEILPKEWKKYLFSKWGLFGGIAILSPVVFIAVWSVKTGQNGIFRSDAGAAQSGLMQRVVLTLKAMVGKLPEAVNLHNGSLYLSYLSYLIIALGLVCAVYPLVLGKNENSRYRNLMYVYIGGFAIYFLVMLFAYITVFEYADSVNAISLNRYFSDYMMLGAVPLTIPLFKRSEGERKQSVLSLKKGIIFVMILCCVYGSSKYFLSQFAHVYAVEDKNYSEREKFIDYTDKIKKMTNENGKIYFVNQSKTGLFTLVADYEMGEQLSRGGMCFKFRKDKSKRVGGLTEYDITTLPEVLAQQGYEYLWVYSTNTYFNDYMDSLFHIDKVKKGNFYKVVVTETGVGLEYMANVQ